MPSENTRRIAKNTGFLYVRMLLMMGVAFYTSRVVLNALGVEDFGIYNVVGGVVAMFSFLTGTFTSATQRFLNFEMGLGNQERLNEIFSMSITLNVMIAVLMIVFSEIVGIWFINHKLVIPPDRLVAAHWVFHFSLLTMAVTIISTPYNAVIIANERMNVFAYISIVEALLKLGVAITIVFCGSDKLIVYGALQLLLVLIVRIIYSTYCKKKFREFHYRFYWDKKLFREMGTFAGWNMYGSFAFVMINQGMNMLLNMFFGPVVNASCAIAMQVHTAINGFAVNFTMAVNPRIVQDYAQGNKEGVFQLVFYSSKFSFFLLLLLASPIFLDTEWILKIWLRQTPDYSVVFVRLILIQMLIRILQNPLHTLMHATGRMKKYQLIDGTLLLLNIPVSYWLLKEGGDATVVFTVSILLTFVALLALLYVVKSETGLSVCVFFRKVMWNVLKVSVLLWIIMYVFTVCIPKDGGSIYFMKEVGILLVTILLIWGVGMDSVERVLLKEYWNVFLMKIHVRK